MDYIAQDDNIEYRAIRNFLDVSDGVRMNDAQTVELHVALITTGSRRYY